MVLQCHILDTPEKAGAHAAQLIADAATAAIACRGRCSIALSGGSTPRPLLEALATASLDWQRMHVFQVDERIAAAASGHRNASQILSSLIDRVPLPKSNLHLMPVEADDREAAARSYFADMSRIAGTPPRLDVVHLGLGEDGHTASLVPGDPALKMLDAGVAVSGIYQGYRRMTLTFPVLDAARLVLFFVTGSSKQNILARLVAGDEAIPAARVRADGAILVADRAAMPQAVIRT